MRIVHDTRPCTPSGHSAFKGYDAVSGKLQSLSLTGRVYVCDCGKRFASRDDRDEHQRRARCGGAA